MAGNNLLNFTNIAQPHIHYQSWNKQNQDTIKEKHKIKPTANNKIQN